MEVVQTEQVASSARFIRPLIADFPYRTTQIMENAQEALGRFQAQANKKGIKPLEAGSWFLTDGIAYTFNGQKGRIPLPLQTDSSLNSLVSNETNILEGEGKWRFSMRMDYIGEYAINNGLIAFVNQNGELFVGKDEPENEEVLQEAGYRANKNVWVPFSNGEEITDEQLRKQFDAFRGVQVVASQGQEKIADVASRVGSRLVEISGEKGIRILGKDSWGNWRAESIHNQEYDLVERRNVPARIVITPNGRTYIHDHPGILHGIEKGNLSPTKLFEKGSSSLVVHPEEYPDICIKYIRFAPSGTMTEAKSTYYLTQSATGVDHLYWKLGVKKVLEPYNMTAAQPLFATRDVLVEEYINGLTLIDFIRSRQQSCTEQEVLQLIQTFTEITQPLSEEFLEFMQNEASKSRLPYQLPIIFDVAPPHEWTKNPIYEGKIIPHSSLANWIIKGEPRDVQIDIAKLPKEEQETWLREHMVLVDPFATYVSLTEDEARQVEATGIHPNGISIVSKNEKPETFGTQPEIKTNPGTK